MHDIYDIRIPLPFSCQTQINVSSGHVVTIESRALASVSALLRKSATASVLFSSSCALISTSCRVGRQLKADMTPQNATAIGSDLFAKKFLLKALEVTWNLSGPDPKSQESEVAANHSDDTRKLEGLDLLDPMSYTSDSVEHQSTWHLHTQRYSP